MRRVRLTKDRLYKRREEGKNTRNHKREDRTAEKLINQKWYTD
jgi:hypothetical protein